MVTTEKHKTPIEYAHGTNRSVNFSWFLLHQCHFEKRVATKISAFTIKTSHQWVSLPQPVQPTSSTVRVAHIQCRAHTGLCTVGLEYSWCQVQSGSSTTGVAHCRGHNYKNYLHFFHHLFSEWADFSWATYCHLFTTFIPKKTKRLHTGDEYGEFYAFWVQLIITFTPFSYIKLE